MMINNYQKKKDSNLIISHNHSFLNNNIQWYKMIKDNNNIQRYKMIKNKIIQNYKAKKQNNYNLINLISFAVFFNI